MLSHSLLGPASFALAFLSWVVVTAWLLSGRIRHDARQQAIRRARARLERAAAARVGATERERRVRRLLDRVPARVIEAVACDSATPGAMAAVFATHAIRRRGAIRVLQAAAAHRGERQRWRRIRALRVLSLARHPRAMTHLRQAVLDADRDVVGAAVALLGGMETAGAAALLADTLREDRYPRSRVAAQLDLFVTEVREVVLPLARDLDPKVRFWAATLLARYAGDRAAAAALVQLARDDDPSVRKAAVESLGRSRAAAGPSVALDLLEDEVWYVRAHAARALGDLRRHDLAPAVLPLLADREWWVRTAAKDALQAMGERAAPAVARALEHPDRFARNGAAEVLQNLGVLDRAAERVGRGREAAADRALLRRAAAAGGSSLARAITRGNLTVSAAIDAAPEMR